MKEWKEKKRNIRTLRMTSKISSFSWNGSQDVILKRTTVATVESHSKDDIQISTFSSNRPSGCHPEPRWLFKQIFHREKMLFFPLSPVCRFFTLNGNSARCQSTKSILPRLPPGSIIISIIVLLRKEDVYQSCGLYILPKLNKQVSHPLTGFVCLRTNSKSLSSFRKN